MKNIKFLLLSALLVVLAGVFCSDVATATDYISTNGSHNHHVLYAMSGITIAPNPMRQAYTLIREKLSGYSNLLKNIQPSYLRVEQAIANGTNLYTFDIQQSSGANPWEKKLNQNDIFYITHLGLAMYQSTTTNTRQRAKLQYYPNPNYFTETGATNFKNAALWCFYNGYYRIQVGDTVFLDSFATDQFLYTPDVQAGTTSAAVIDTTDAITTYSIANSGYRDFKGMAPVQPIFALNGYDQNEITLTVPLGSNDSNAVATDVSGSTNYIVWRAFGFLVKGAGAVVETDQSLLYLA